MLRALPLLVLSLASAASADERAKVVVLDARAVGVVEQKQIDGLSALVASELQSRGHKVISGSDLRALVGYEKQRQLLGCDDSGCLAEIGGALGADYIVGIEVSRIGATWLLSMALVQTRTGQALERITEKRDSLDRIVEAATRGVTRIAGALPVPPAQRGTGAVPPAAIAATSTAPPATSTPVLRWSLFGVGTAAAIVGAILEAQALGTRSSYDRSLSGAPTVTLAQGKSAATGSAAGITLLAAGAGLDLIALLAVH